MIKLGVRGSTDSVNHILIKIDDLTLMTTENLFLAGQDYRIKTGKNLVELLNSLSRDHQISASENVVKEIEDALSIKNEQLKNILNKWT